MKYLVTFQMAGSGRVSMNTSPWPTSELEAAIEEKLELIKRQAADLLRGKKAMEP